MRAVILGNAGDLLNRERGASIDSADRVIRINSFRLEGIEKFVGTAIDVVSLNLCGDVLHGALPHSASLIRQAREIWTPSSENDIKQGLSDIEPLLGVAPERVRTAAQLGATASLDDAYRRGQKTLDDFVQAGGWDDHVTEFGGSFLPTIGFLTVFMSHGLFPRWHLQIAGFGLTTSPSRVRVDTSGNGMWKGHHLESERQILLEGAQQGRWELI
jgi:hypothetical protein